MVEGVGVGAANQVGDDEGRAGCMLGGGSLVKGSSLKFQLSSTDIHNGCACFLFIFCYTCKPEVDFWIYGAGRGCLCHEENTYWSEFLSFLKGGGVSGV